MSERMDIAYPFTVDQRGQIAVAAYADHVAQMIEQVLLTAPGERVNRPDFGVGVLQLVFSPADQPIDDGLRHLVTAELHRFLGEVIRVQGVDISFQDGRLQVRISYLLLRDGTARVHHITRGHLP